MGKKRKKKTYTPPPAAVDFKRARMAVPVVPAVVPFPFAPPPPPPPPPPAALGDGVLRVMYVPMGQGDCALLATPGGQTLMIDCGTSGFDAGDTYALVSLRAQNALYDDLFIGRTNLLNMLILTHPDSDHYNQIPTVVRPGTTIEKVYHSSAFDDYGSEHTSDWIKTAVGDDTKIKRVIHNADKPNTAVDGEVSLAGVPVLPGVAPDVEVLDAAGGIVILREPNCTITIYAAGVSHAYEQDNSDASNRGSIVTLVESRGIRLLFCGDATRNTEHYLLNRFMGRLKGVDLTTIGHHASDWTSSLEEYVTELEAKSAVASAPQNVAKHHLPEWKALNRYDESLTARAVPAVAAHRLRAWRGKNNQWGELTTPVYTTGSTGPIIREYEP